MDEDIALSIEHLSKSYGDLKAVDDISFTVKKGSLFAFLGINGAGKSTTINIICNILPKDAGTITVGGLDLDKSASAIKKDIGIVFQTSVLDKELTVKENLEIRTAFYSLSKEEKRRNLDEIIRLLELSPILNKPIRNLSGGQMRRVDIARAMVHRPRLLILDEPTTGLDPKTRLAVWSLIDSIRSETGMTVFLTTHIIAHGTPNELKNLYSSDRIICHRAKDTAFEAALEAAKRSYSYDAERGCYRIDTHGGEDAKEVLQKFGTYITDFELLKGDMDDVFLNVTGKNMTLAGGENG